MVAISDKPIAVIINGPARVGKTSALRHLKDLHGDSIAVFDPGRALKTHYMINRIAPQSAQGRGDDAQSYLFYMRETQDHWVNEYEKLKADNKITRDMIILYAESIKAIYHDFFIDLAGQLMILTESTSMIWAESINQLEFFPLKQKLTTLVGPSNIATVRLECKNPHKVVTGDTRTPIKECKNIVQYRLKDSKLMAEYIFNNREDLASNG